MNFTEKLQNDMIAAAKSQNKARLSALRLIKAAFHNREIDLKRPLNEGENLQVLASMVKQRKDSIEQFAKGGRMDLVEKEEAELQIIQEFMPSQMSEEDLTREIETAIAEAGATNIKDLGKVMKILMPVVTGRADGKTLSEKVKKILSG
jgi:uncharacterized protein